MSAPRALTPITPLQDKEFIILYVTEFSESMHGRIGLLILIIVITWC